MNITKSFLSSLAKGPGVYLMKDKAGEVLYVGKAKSIKARVRSYFSGTDTRASIPHLVEKIFSIETIVTETERQALVLESDLIKKFKPHYNIRLKDDKAYLIVRIDTNHEWPKVELVRQVRDDGATYIGPFVFSYEIKTLYEVVKKTLMLRSCTDKVLYNRVRPCLEYQIKRCMGPCCLPVSKEQYAEAVKRAILIFKGKDKEVVRQLESEISNLSAHLQFEEAALLRDQLELLKKSTKERLTEEFSFSSQDAIGLYYEDTKAVVSVLSVRRGRIFGADTFSFDEVVIPQEELLSQFLSQYYAVKQDVPEEVLLPFSLEDSDVLEEYFLETKGLSFSFKVPQKGPKFRLLNLAAENAKESYHTKFLGDASSELVELTKWLDLAQTPRTIECVDISHFQGRETVASVVRFKDGKPDKDSYRRFILKVEGKPDDFASMREVLTRHLSRAAEEGTMCDLLLIDGGPAQLSQGLYVRDMLGLNDPPMISIAKKRVKKGKKKDDITEMLEKSPERIFIENNREPIILPAGSKSLNLLERLRNEAHRFALKFHRERRSKRLLKS